MKVVGVVGTVFTMLTFGALAVTGEQGQVQVVDTKGKPPYKRKMVDAPVNDVAQFEEVDVVKTIKKRVVVSYQGKPPYTRRTVEVPVKDVAQFEGIDEPGNGTQKRGTRPPFKR